MGYLFLVLIAVAASCVVTVTVVHRYERRLKYVKTSINSLNEQFAKLMADLGGLDPRDRPL